MHNQYFEGNSLCFFGKKLIGLENKKIIDFVKKFRFVIIAYFVVILLIAPMINMFKYVVINTEDFLYGIYSHRIL